LTKIKNYLHVSSFEKLIFKVHVVALFRQFGNFAKFIHIQLPNEGRDVLVPEIVR